VQESQNGVITTFHLEQNYPNAFNPETHLAYNLPYNQSNARASLQIFDPLGQLVQVLVDEQQAAGHHFVTWNGRDQRGRRRMGSGIYFYRLCCNSYQATQKMILLQ